MPKVLPLEGTFNFGHVLVEKMKSLLGIPYIWGGKSPENGLDCSGAITYTMAQLNLVPKSFPGSTNSQTLYKMSKPIAAAEVKAGDLAFYGSTGLFGLFPSVSHVMMATGDGKLIGSSGGGPSTTSLEIAKQQNAKVKILPSTYRAGLVGYGRLPMVA